MLPKASLGDTQLAISCEFDFYVHLFLNKPPYDTLRIDYQYREHFNTGLKHPDNNWVDFLHLIRNSYAFNIYICTAVLHSKYKKNC